MRLLRLFAIVLFPALALAQGPMPVASAPPVNPYEAVVPLADTSPGGETAALREALATVIATVTGLADIRTQPAAGGVLERAQQLVQHYGSELDPISRQPMFRAAFDPRAVDEALKRQGLPVFGLLAGAEQDWPVEVHGVHSFRDYGRATTTLRRLRGVKNVQVQSVEGDDLKLRVRFEGDAQALARAIAAGAPAVLYGSDSRNPLQLFLRPG